MLISIAYILLIGLSAGWMCKKCRLPSLLGMVITGIVLGPYMLNLIDSSILDISPELRKIALIIILMRAGLSLNLRDLRKAGRPAILMCFLPACFEILGMIILAPTLLQVSILDAAIMGAVVGAVSPAVIVPKMIQLMEDGYGIDKGIPQLILAGASVDDVFVIIVFTALTGLAQGGAVSAAGFVGVPISLVLGVTVGVATGYLLNTYFTKVHMRDTVKIIIVLCIAFAMATLEDKYSAVIPFSALVAVMSSGVMLREKNKEVAGRLSIKLNKLWVGAEIMLFVLVGATVDITYALQAGGSAIILVFGVLIFRMLGVLVCLIKTRLLLKERVFCMIGYLPKATVQAAIGGIPLAMGLSCGNIVLTVAVLAILITAPLGAFLIDVTYRRFLTQEKIQS